VRLQIWDTAGQERFRSLIPSYIRDCAIAFVLYDISGILFFKEELICILIDLLFVDRTSFENVKEWISRIRNEGGENAIIMLCGNKLDLVELNQRKVMTEEGEALAKDLNLLFGEVSAKTGENVKTVFHTAAAQLPSPESNAPQLENIEKGALPKPVNLEASGPKPGELGCAC
jgi:Ras-related protein Rab-6A